MSVLALLGGGVRVRIWIRGQRKDQNKIKGTTKPLVANLNITQSSCMLAQCQGLQVGRVSVNKHTKF